MEATKVFTIGWINKENVLYVYNGILFSHKNKEILPFATTWMKLEDIVLSEISETETSYTIWSYLYVKLEQKNKTKLINREEIGSYQRWGWGEKWMKVVKKYKLLVVK